MPTLVSVRNKEEIKQNLLFELSAHIRPIVGLDKPMICGAESKYGVFAKPFKGTVTKLRRPTCVKDVKFINAYLFHAE